MNRKPEDPGVVTVHPGTTGRSRTTILGYGLAVIAVALALGGSISLRLDTANAFLLFVAAIALVTWFAGLGPGLLASVGSASLASIYFLPYPDTPLVSVGHIACWGTFLLISLLVGWGIMPPELSEDSMLGPLFAHSRARSALARQRALLEAVLRQMPEGVVIAEAPGGRIVLRNEQGSRILRGAGEPPAGVEDFVRKLPLRRDSGRFYEPDEWPLARALWRGEIVTGEELEISTPGGTRNLRVSAAPVLSQDGSLAAGVATFSDITEQKRSAEAQRFLMAAGMALGSSLDYPKTLSAVARLTIPALADWCLVEVAEEDGRIRHVAEAHIIKEQEPLLRDIALRCGEDPQGMQLVRSVLDTGKTTFSPEIGPGATEPAGFADFRPVGAVSGVTVPLRARGKTVGVISLFYSVSGRRYSLQDVELAEDLARRAALALDNARLYREAQEAGRIKDEFLATVSHELRTPLQAMLGWTRLLRTRRVDAAMFVHGLEVIERNAAVQHKLIDDILDLSSLIRGKVRFTVRPTDLVPVIEHAIEACVPAAEAKSIRIDFFPDPDTGVVSGDPDRLQQVFWNLLSNAIKFTSEGGCIEVRLARNGRSAQVAVSDNGKGIRPDVLPHIFERFRQGDGTTARRYGGLGMGLAIVRHTVEMHGGSVQADSAGEGRGARFIVMLPLKESRRIDPVLPRVTEPEGRQDPSMELTS